MKALQNIPNCNECKLKFKCIFKSLSESEIDKITLEKGCNFHKKGSIIYHEGNRINGVYCINKGIAKIYKTGIEGKEQIIHFAKQGEIIGYRSVLSGELACTSAKVIEDVVACYIPADTFYSLIKSNPAFSFELLQLACKELGEANSFITDIAQKSVRERLAEVLLLLKDKFNIDNESNLQISLTREELANIVGTATESVIRLLSEFKTDKLIEIEGRKIKLLNIKGLTKVANF
jgi:CRP-like cAMP-binding protein